MKVTRDDSGGVGIPGAASDSESTETGFVCLISSLLCGARNQRQGLAHAKHGYMLSYIYPLPEPACLELLMN